jgi:hypothetical protein
MPDGRRSGIAPHGNGHVADVTATGSPAQALDFDKAFRQLCHVAAITVDGREVGAVDNIVVTTLTLDSDLRREDADVVAEGIEAYFGVVLPRRLVADSISRLITSGRLARASNDGLVVSPEARSEVESRARAANELEKRVRNEWLVGLGAPSTIGVSPDIYWDVLQRFAARMFRRHGAETILLLDPGVVQGNLSGSLSTYMNAALDEVHVAAGDRQALRDAVRDFFNTTTLDRTRYLAQLLDGTFTFFALSADDATSGFLRNSLPDLKLFLDTNFIFGLVGVNDDELNTVARELIEFIQVNGFPFALYYHEKTLEEAERTLGAIGARLKSRIWPRGLSAAAVQAGAGSAVELTYHQVNAKQGMDPDAFMARYGHVRVLLDALGLKIYREPPEDEAAQKRRWLLVAEYDDFKKRARPDRLRRYEALDHDVSVWISVQRLRTPGRSTLQSGAAFLSADHLLYRFDWDAKRRGGSGSVVLPSQLLALLRPFVAMNPDFDRRFVQTFAVPEFRTSSTNYQATASRVLSYLASLGDLPQPTAVAILKDEILMTRVKKTRDDSPDFRHEIDSAIVAANGRLQAENERLKAEGERLRATIAPDAVSAEPPMAATSAPSASLTAPHETRPQAIPARPRAQAITVRLSALVVALVLVIVAAGVSVFLIPWESLAPPSDGVEAVLQRGWRAFTGVLGLSLLIYGALVLWTGAIHSREDYLVAALRHRAFAAALVLAVGASLLIAFGLQ